VSIINPHTNQPYEPPSQGMYAYAPAEDITLEELSAIVMMLFFMSGFGVHPKDHEQFPDELKRHFIFMEPPSEQ